MYTYTVVDFNGTETVFTGFRVWEPGDLVLCVTIIDDYQQLWAIDPKHVGEGCKNLLAHFSERKPDSLDLLCREPW